MFKSKRNQTRDPKIKYAINREEKLKRVADREIYILPLKEEFARRRQVDFTYSLREYARDLKMDPMHLWRVLNNKCGLSRIKAEQISTRLSLSHERRKKFVLVVTAVSARSKNKRNMARMGIAMSKINKPN